MPRKQELNKFRFLDFEVAIALANSSTDIETLRKVKNNRIQGHSASPRVPQGRYRIVD